MNKNSSLILGLMLSTAIVVPAGAADLWPDDGTTISGTIADTYNIDHGYNVSFENVNASNISIATYGGSVIYSSGNVSIKNSTFASNSALDDDGGAILSYTPEGSLKIENSTFTSNKASIGGAIAAYRNSGKTTISNSTFKNNEATEIGALYLLSETSISGSTFEGNKSTNTSSSATYDAGGALWVGSETVTDISDTTFSSNTSGTNGGAIAMRRFDRGNNTAAKLDISNATFSSNEAQTTGGAIDNYLYGSKGKSGSVYVSDSTFTSNSAKDGGAIFNHIGKDGEILNAGAKQVGNIYLNNATFTSNTASSKGGAIYNEGILSLAGTSTFTGNTAGGSANDIYNEGTVNIDGEYKTDGGIVNNDAGSVVFASSSKFNAALENGTAYIQGGTVTGSTNLVIDNSVSESWIQMFDKAQTFSLTNSLYDITEDEGTAGKYNIGKKSADEVVENLEEQGVSESAAQTIAAVAQSTSDHEAIKAISEAVQTGDVKAAEQAAEELAPSKANEVLSIATSINKMIYQAVENRLMALGRSSGDLLKGGAFWVQGLYNQAKQDKSSRVEGFSADSSGVSFGFDAELTDALTIGLGYGHTKTDASTDTRDIDVDGDNVFVYGKYQPSQWYVNTMLSYGNARYSEKKAPAGVKMKANYDVNTYAANIMAGYEYANGFTPEAGLRYLYARQNDYKDGAQSVKTDSNDVLTAVLGAKYERSLETKHMLLKPSVKVAATYDVMSDNSKAHVAILGGGNYQVQGKRLHRFGVETTLGLGTSCNNWDFDVQYVGAFREDFHSNTILGKIKYNF